MIVGTLFPPSPAGAVEAVQGGPEALADDASSRDARAATRPTAAVPPAIPTDPVVVSPEFGGTSIEARDHAAEYPEPPPLASLTGYRWPLPNGRITLPFGPSRWGSRVVAGVPFHDGLDLATFCGDRIVAAHDGIVLAAGRRYDAQMGWIGDLQPYLDRLEAKGLWWTLPIVIVIDDGNGYRSMYASGSIRAWSSGCCCPRGRPHELTHCRCCQNAGAGSSRRGRGRPTRARPARSR